MFGLVATSALTAVMTSAQLAGLTRLDLPLVLGTLVTQDPDRARFAGFLIHLVVGQAFALGYAAVFALLHQATWWLGGCSDSCTSRWRSRFCCRSSRASTRGWHLTAPARRVRPCSSRRACSP